MHLFMLRTRRVLACTALLLVTQASFAQTPRTVFLEDLTWTELRDQLQAGKTTILIPIGGTEQSGPYVALGKHNARVKILSQRIAEGLGNALVAPVIAYVPEGGTAPTSSHMRFPGTITVPDEVFKKPWNRPPTASRCMASRTSCFWATTAATRRTCSKWWPS